MELVPPDPMRRLPDSIQLRLDRIVPSTLKLLPTTLPPQRRGVHTWTVTYQLTADVARRRDFMMPFADSVVDYHDDGSATISGVTSNLWQARQTLLRYGSACTVLEPTELIALFHETIRGMAANYKIHLV